jgi:CubicO group peptidase (beta-lactamase class C family)
VNEGVIEALGMANTRIVGSLAHGAVSSVRDLSTWASTALAHRLVDPATWADAVTAQFPTIDGVVPGFGTQRPCPWGLGPEVRGAKEPHWVAAAAGPDSFGHSGASGCLAWYAPAADTAFAILGARTADSGWLLRRDQRGDPGGVDSAAAPGCVDILSLLGLDFCSGRCERGLPTPAPAPAGEVLGCAVVWLRRNHYLPPRRRGEGARNGEPSDRNLGWTH